MSDKTYILAGLGNPGDKYQGTRHNIGFDVIDQFAQMSRATSSSEKWDSITSKATIFGCTIHLVKPMTFMNLSGRSIARFVNFYKIPMERLVVVHDDLDMKTGRLKLVSGGGNGGHNGIRSIVQSLGVKDFYRLKIGIGRPGQASTVTEMPVEKYVLTGFQEDERDAVDKRIPAVMEGLELFFCDGAAQSMNFINSFK